MKPDQCGRLNQTLSAIEKHDYEFGQPEKDDPETRYVASGHAVLFSVPTTMPCLSSDHGDDSGISPWPLPLSPARYSGALCRGHHCRRPTPQLLARDPTNSRLASEFQPAPSPGKRPKQSLLRALFSRPCKVITQFYG
jgi:hypothetical protein